MSMMAEMMGDMLKKALPPEVMALLTPEKIQELGERMNAFIADLRGSLGRLEANQILIMEALNVNGSNDKCGAGSAAGSIGQLDGVASSGDGND